MNKSIPGLAASGIIQASQMGRRPPLWRMHSVRQPDRANLKENGYIPRVGLEDAETGSHYNYFRDYEPQTGRYVQSDPVGLEGGANTFLYANANPLKFVDHLGLSPWRPDERWANCSDEDMRECEAICGLSGRKVESCRRKWIKATEITGGEVARGWKPSTLSCKCEETFCERNTEVCAAGAATGAVLLFILRAGAACAITVAGA